MLLHEGQRLGGQLILRRKHRAPDLGGRHNVGQRQTKRLHHHPAVVFHGLQGVERLIPVHMTGTGNAAVVFRDVHKHRPRGGRMDRRREILLLDVGMKGVVHHPHRRMVDRLHKPHRLLDARKKVILEPIQVFRGDRHARLGGMLGHLPHRVDAPLEFVFRRPRVGEFTDGRVRWAAEDLHAGGVAAAERLLHRFDSRGPHRGRRADRVVARPANRHSRPLESDRIEPLAPLLVERLVEFEDRHLDAVVADRLHLLDDGHHAIVHAVGPKEKIEAVFHGGHLRGTGRNNEIQTRAAVGRQGQSRTGFSLSKVGRASACRK